MNKMYIPAAWLATSRLKDIKRGEKMLLGCNTFGLSLLPPSADGSPCSSASMEDKVNIRKQSRFRCAHCALTFS